MAATGMSEDRAAQPTVEDEIRSTSKSADISSGDGHAPNQDDKVAEHYGGSSNGGHGRGHQNQRGRRLAHSDTARRGGRDTKNGSSKRSEKGRGEWSRNPVDKRKRNDEVQAAKRQKVEDGETSKTGIEFSTDEIAGEERRPKRKVAVLIGYAGTGYKGMQINGHEKTIEGDLFNAFVLAGAISKVNADDPKKSSLVRCARTDKGVHAAGNVISLKLIVEDERIVERINEHLPPQIRVWGIERTVGGFSCYQTCDSRWYEYLIPTHAFLPPHPKSFLGKRLEDSAKHEAAYASYCFMQEDVADFWAKVERDYVQPLLKKLDADSQAAVLESLHRPEEARASSPVGSKTDDFVPTSHAGHGLVAPKTADSPAIGTLKDATRALSPVSPALSPGQRTDTIEDTLPKGRIQLTPVEEAVKAVKAAYITAKKAYRISDVRRQRVQDALSKYLGTQNFHNYTVQKSYNDPSAKRVIRSFKVGAEPIIINDTEWLSLKVHGQSFMMHQIRKMVAMAALVVRCGCVLDRISESFGQRNISIPKAPGLGLLLERPVFDSYNERAVREFEREKIDFSKYEENILAFKQNEIYERIFEAEEHDHQFHAFFHHIDNYRTAYFLWVTATGIQASKQALMKGESVTHGLPAAVDSEDEGDVHAEGG